ncbi:MAG: glycosyltransferase [Steroidobacter sp.]
MKFFLTTTGTRGDVQPLVALALELRTLGHQCRFCVPPNFTQWIQEYGFENIPIGIDIEQSTRTAAQKKIDPLPPDQLKQVMNSTISYQFSALLNAARGCDVIVGGGIIQIPTRSVAEILRIPCIFSMYCPVVYPSTQHSPPPMSVERRLDLAALPAWDHESLWINEEQYWNDLYRDVLNQERAKFSLAPLQNVMRHALEGQSLLAADATITPMVSTIMYDIQAVQTGVWMLRETNELPDNVERFLAEGEAPIYFGCGSMVVKENEVRTFVETARSLGRRAVVHKGWSDIQPIDDGRDCLFVGTISHEKLFPRMTAIVHHGGAGTTMAAVRSGVRQVIVPHAYDQFYLAQRIQQLGVGVAGPNDQDVTTAALTISLQECLKPEITERARMMAGRIQLNGATIAANWLAENYG